MKICFLVAKIAFLSFFILNAWNLFHQSSVVNNQFQHGIEEIQKTLKSKFSTQILKDSHINYLLTHSETIVKYLIWAQLTFAIAAIFICGGLSVFSVSIYSILTFINDNMIKIINDPSLVKLSKVLLLCSLLTASLALSGCSKNSSKGGCSLSAAHCPVKKNK